MKRALPLLALLALSGCAHKVRYVAVPCLTPAQLETLKAGLPPKVADRLTGDANQDLRIISGSAVRLRGFAEGLLDVLAGCAKG